MTGIGERNFELSLQACSRKHELVITLNFLIEQELPLSLRPQDKEWKQRSGNRRKTSQVYKGMFSKLGVGLIYGCGLYMDVYGILFLKEVFLERET